MHEVSAAVPFGLLRLIEAQGGRIDRLLEDLDYRPADFDTHYQRVPWNDFTLFLDRVQQALGDVLELQRLGFALALSHPPYQKLAGLMDEPMQLLTLVNQSFKPSLYGPALRTVVQPLSVNQVRIVYQIDPPYRPSLAFMHTSLGTLRALPVHLGLPAAHIEAELRARKSVYQVTLPKVQRDRASLLPEQKESVRLLVEQLLAERIADIALVCEPQGARKKAPSPCPPRLSYALAKRLRGTTAARGAMAQPGAKELEQRVLSVKRGWALSPRQQQVLQLVLQGRSNKEIAAQLGCVVGTVENHLTALFRKAQVESRTMLTAKFWGTAEGAAGEVSSE